MDRPGGSDVAHQQPRCRAQASAFASVAPCAPARAVEHIHCAGRSIAPCEPAVAAEHVHCGGSFVLLNARSPVRQQCRWTARPSALRLNPRRFLVGRALRAGLPALHSPSASPPPPRPFTAPALASAILRAPPPAAGPNTLGWLILGVCFEAFMRMKGRFPGGSPADVAPTLVLAESCYAMAAPAALSRPRAALGAALVIFSVLAEAGRRWALARKPDDPLRSLAVGAAAFSAAAARAVLPVGLVGSAVVALFPSSGLAHVYRACWWLLYGFVCFAAASRPARGGSPGEGARRRRSPEAVAAELEAAGAAVYPPSPETPDAFDWGEFRGYASVKAQVEESLVSVFAQAALARKLAAATRESVGGPTVPRAVLFQGPPGVGKTLCARMLARKCASHLVYLSGEMFLSQYYGESEKRLARIFRLARALGERVFIFVDEIESLLVRRGAGEVEGATNQRLLSIFLRQLDGFEGAQGGCTLTLIGATNRREDLDRALLSRFEVVVEFGLPGQKDRLEILREYARHLARDDVAALAIASDGLSARNIRDAAVRAERRLLFEVSRGTVSPEAGLAPEGLAVMEDGVPLPSVGLYEWALAEVREKEAAGAGGRGRDREGAIQTAARIEAALRELGLGREEAPRPRPPRPRPPPDAPGARGGGGPLQDGR